MLRVIFCVVLMVAAIAVRAQSQEDPEVRKSIFFGGGSYAIDDFQVQELYQWLDSFPNLLEKYEIQLISHTDPIGGKAYNEWLSKMRSEAVQNLLLHHEIPEHKISIKDWGLANPVYNNTSYQGMQLNRRVDVILYPIIF